VVTNPEIRAKLRDAGYGQPKITDASHLIVLAIRKNIDDAFVDTYVALTAETRGVTVESLKGFGDMMKGVVIAKPPEARNEWSARQVYLALGVLLAAAASEGIDAGPMEGFDPKKFDEILGLEALGLETKVIVALGHRASTDAMARAAKVRFPKEEVVMEV
jgi:nitroreductase/dihydropteridine reductase